MKILLDGFEFFKFDTAGYILERIVVLGLSIVQTCVLSSWSQYENLTRSTVFAPSFTY